jgi:hypothetical protein
MESVSESVRSGTVGESKTREPRGELLLRLSLAWVCFSALAALAPLWLVITTEIKWWGLTHAHPLVVLALTGAMLGGLVVVPALLCCGAAAMARGRLPRRRYLSAILPLNLAALGSPWLAYWIVDALARG